MHAALAALRARRRAVVRLRGEVADDRRRAAGGSEGRERASRENRKTLLHGDLRCVACKGPAWCKPFGARTAKSHAAPAQDRRKKCVTARSRSEADPALNEQRMASGTEHANPARPTSRRALRSAWRACSSCSVRGSECRSDHVYSREAWARSSTPPGSGSSGSAARIDSRTFLPKLSRSRSVSTTRLPITTGSPVAARPNTQQRSTTSSRPPAADSPAPLEVRWK